MIKKFVNFIQELSLTQQLLVIIMLFTISFTSFFVVLLDHNVSNFIDDQIYNILELSQNDIIFSFQQGMPIDTLVKRQDPNMGTIVIQENTYYVVGMRLSETLKKEKLIVDAYNQLNTFEHYKLANSTNDIYYTIRKTPTFTYITYMYESYGTVLRNTLTSNIINILVLVVFALFMLLLLWVATIIQPLKQIRSYIDKIKVNQKAELKITRKDEIGELAMALVALKEELDYQENLKTELVHNVSHDLKTPIATIKSYGESIKDGIYPYETLEKSVDVIIDHATRLEKKVHSLLLLNRLSFVEDENLEDVVDVAMEEVIRQVILAIKVINLDIKFDCTLVPTTFRGSFENWRIVVENIVDNALRYAKTNITITLNGKELVIKNDGDQISSDQLHSIFKAYEKGTDGNFGLGLSIAYKIVTQAGYFIVAENTTDGVQFRIFKPNFN